MKRTRDDITKEVMAVVSLVRGTKVSSPALTLETRIIQDLQLGPDVDDFVLLLQERTGIKPSRQGWQDARTIGDVVDLLLKHATENS